MTGVLSVDPGLAKLGVVLLWRHEQEWVCLDAKTLTTSPKQSLDERLRRLWHGIRSAGWSGHLDLVVCESQSEARQGNQARGTTSADAALVEQVVGMVRAYAYERSIPFVEVTPSESKHVLGGMKRTATKAEVARAIRAIVKGLPLTMSEHAADAAAHAVAGERKWRQQGGRAR